MSPGAPVIWHDLECGTYDADLELWTRLAAEHDGPVLDAGAGTGRVTLALARTGAEVIALDRDAELLAELARRADGERLDVTTLVADAREFSLPSPVGLCLAPMQTVQLLGGAGGRARFLRCARAVLAPGAVLAAAIATELEPFDVDAGFPEPLPDVGEVDGTVYCSRPVAIRPDGDGFVLERRREVVAPDGELTASADAVHLDRLGADTLEAEGRAAGFAVAPRLEIPATPDYSGSTVVVLGG